MPGHAPTQITPGSICFAMGRCPLGALLVATSVRGACAIFLGDDPQELERKLRKRFPGAQPGSDDTAPVQVLAQVAGFIESPSPSFNLPLDIRGTSFQQRVWQALREIPVGSTETYAALARRIGMPTAVRAVARACASNLLAIAVPCHRVVGSDGSLSGYRWGVQRKRALLERERQAIRSAG
jgi:AraC family transcriptional regulator of adaptative response/methylated-DNA-[protein]-cysteine methyltransferase